MRLYEVFLLLATASSVGVSSVAVSLPAAADVSFDASTAAGGLSLMGKS